MIKVFIGGSRRLSRLNQDVKNRLDNIIRQKHTILIGDANGADRSVQDYLFNRHYGDVIVFCMENKCRNNLGKWTTKSVEVVSHDKDLNYYTGKDLQMAKEADCAFMIWDGKSKGTLRNIINLLKASKELDVYCSPEKNIIHLANFNDLQDLLAKSDEGLLRIFEKDLELLQKSAYTNDKQPAEPVVSYPKPTQLPLLPSYSGQVVREK